MANRLSMAEIEAILTLHKTRHTNRAISRLLEVDRGTVGKYIALAEVQNQPNSPPGTGTDVAGGSSPVRSFERYFRHIGPTFTKTFGAPDTNIPATNRSATNSPVMNSPVTNSQSTHRQGPHGQSANGPVTSPGDGLFDVAPTTTTLNTTDDASAGDDHPGRPWSHLLGGIEMPPAPVLSEARTNELANATSVLTTFRALHHFCERPANSPRPEISRWPMRSTSPHILTPTKTFSRIHASARSGQLRNCGASTSSSNGPSTPA